MKHQHIDQLRGVADIEPAVQPKPMTRRERLERWATLLEREPQRRLRSLGEIELKTRAERHAMRADNSPLTIAFEDPVFKVEGLESDKLGDALKFFDLSENEAHYLLCSCYNGYTMTAGTAARRVRATARRSDVLLRTAWVTAAAVAAAPALVYLLG